MIAEKHLGTCTKTQCKYCSGGICVFSLRTKIGCYMEPEVQKITSELFDNAVIINLIQITKEMRRGEII